MVSHQLAKFGGHKHCDSGDIFLVAEEEDSTWLESTRHIILTPILVTRALSSNFCQSVQ